MTHWYIAKSQKEFKALSDLDKHIVLSGGKLKDGEQNDAKGKAQCIGLKKNGVRCGKNVNVKLFGVDKEGLCTIHSKSLNIDTPKMLESRKKKQLGTVYGRNSGQIANNKCSPKSCKSPKASKTCKDSKSKLSKGPKTFGEWVAMFSDDWKEDLCKAISSGALSKLPTIKECNIIITKGKKASPCSPKRSSPCSPKRPSPCSPKRPSPCSPKSSCSMKVKVKEAKECCGQVIVKYGEEDASPIESIRFDKHKDYSIRSDEDFDMSDEDEDDE